jgi:hypothetical protein
MATKKGSSKKSSTKSSKKSSKKSAKKSAARAGITTTTPGTTFPPPPNLRCILACAMQLNKCLQKGVDRDTCIKRFQRCVLKCQGGGGIFDEGGGVGDVE